MDICVSRWTERLVIGWNGYKFKICISFTVFPLKKENRVSKRKTWRKLKVKFKDQVDNLRNSTPNQEKILAIPFPFLWKGHLFS
jgi:hypothetical protein